MNDTAILENYPTFSSKILLDMNTIWTKTKIRWYKFNLDARWAKTNIGEVVKEGIKAMEFIPR
jgi:hypothetical protein